MKLYAGVIVNNESSMVDKMYTYEIPEELISKTFVGSMVRVGFGKGDKAIDGIVLKIFHDSPNFDNIKSIKKVIKNFSVLSNDDINLIDFMREKYLSTYIECVKTIVPSQIFNGLKEKVQEKLHIGDELSGKFLQENYFKIYHTVKENPFKYTVSQLSLKYGFSNSSINTLIKHGFLKKSSTEISRVDKRNYSLYEEKILNSEQQLVFNSIIGGQNNNFLIHGITGSGKTEVYMQLVSYMLLQGKDSIILVPEISLTPQMVERFKGRFGSNVTVFHSKLSDGERYDEWMRVKRGEVKLAIGARSAIFLPFSNLGLVVIDEEHEQSYKSDSDPKYNAREIAEFKQKLNNFKIVLGSATPSIESFYKSSKKEYTLLKMLNRADGAHLPELEVIDMREELKLNNRSIFSRKLFESIENSLLNKEQIILFLNRRGFSSFISCRSCGFVFKCPNCDISLTYHSINNSMECHYCGFHSKVRDTCPKCGSKYVKFFGVGTERVESEVKKYFHNAKILRMDHDTTRRKSSYENIYNTFKNGEADILIGTQMIAKGLDFKNVTLVGVLAADITLNLPDFRSAERNFQLITQVAGRAGRGKKQGKVIVQTYSPEHYSIKAAAKGDYAGFYEEEIKIRESMLYPPFSNLLRVVFTSEKEELLVNRVQDIGIQIKNELKDLDISILGPCPCEISKINKLFRWHMLFKGQIDSSLAKQIKFNIYKLIKNDYNDIRVNVDINPSSLL